MILGQQFITQMMMFGEHDYAEDTTPRDPEGATLAVQKNAPKQYLHDLDPVQKEMVSEEGVRQLNTMQKFKGAV